MQDQNKECLLVRATQVGNLKIVKHLIEEEGVDINVTNTDHAFGLLHNATWQNHSDIVEYLLDQGININYRNKNGTTPLNTACYFGKHEIVEILLRRGADPTIPHDYDFLETNAGEKILIEYTPFETAVNRKYVDVIAVFLEAEINVKSIRKWATYQLFWNDFSISYRKLQRLLKACLERSIAVEEIRECARKFYEFAAREKNDLVKLLCEKYYDLVCDFLHSLLQVCREKDTAKFLIVNKLCVNALDAQGRTPLYIAVQQGDLEMAKLLLECGAVNPIAVGRGHTDIVTYLDKISSSIFPTNTEVNMEI